MHITAGVSVTYCKSRIFACVLILQFVHLKKKIANLWNAKTAHNKTVLLELATWIFAQMPV